MRWDAVVLAGGAGRRLGGVDKAALVIGGQTLLDTTIRACAGARHVAVVGPGRERRHGVITTREDPPGTGPLAALRAGVDALPGDAEIVVVLAADHPGVSPGVVAQLVARTGGWDDLDGTVVVDAAGRVQPLLGAYRAGAIAAGLRRIGDPRDRPFHLLTEHLTLATLTDPVAAADIDTPADLAHWTKEEP